MVYIQNAHADMISPFQELFIQYIAEQGYNVVKSERKPRKTIQYKDLGMHYSIMFWAVGIKEKFYGS